MCAIVTGVQTCALPISLWTNRMHRADVPPRPRIVQLVGAWTRRTDGLRLLGALGFENAHAFAMRGDDARARGIATLDDLARQAPRRSEERRCGTEGGRTWR